MKQETKEAIEKLIYKEYSKDIPNSEPYEEMDESATRGALLLLQHPEILAIEGYVRTNYDQYDTVIILKQRDGEFTKDIKAEKTSNVIALLSTALHVEINDSLQLPTPPKQ